MAEAGLGCSPRLFMLCPLKLEKLLSLEDDTSGLLASSLSERRSGVIERLLSIVSGL